MDTIKKEKKFNAVYFVLTLILGTVFVFLLWFMFTCDITSRVVYFLFFFGWASFVAILGFVGYFIENKHYSIRKTVLLVFLIFVLPLLILDSIYFYGLHTIVAPVLELSSTTSTNVGVSVDGDMIANNHVGNDWVVEASVNGYEYSGNGNISLFSGSKIDIVATVTEQDSIPDIGIGKSSLSASSINLKNGTTITIPVTVTENRGRYSGNTALWNVKITFKGIPPKKLNYWGIVHKVIFG